MQLSMLFKTFLIKINLDERMTYQELKVKKFSSRMTDKIDEWTAFPEAVSVRYVLATQDKGFQGIFPDRRGSLEMHSVKK